MRPLTDDEEKLIADWAQEESQKAHVADASPAELLRWAFRHGVLAERCKNARAAAPPSVKHEHSLSPEALRAFAADVAAAGLDYGTGDGG